MQIKSSTPDYMDGKQHKMSSAVSNEFHNFLTDIEDLFKATTSLSGDDLTKAKAKISARIEEAKESAEDMGNNIVHKARKTAAITNNYVHEQPWTVIAGSAAVSFFVGFLLAKRS